MSPDMVGRWWRERLGNSRIVTEAESSSVVDVFR